MKKFTTVIFVLLVSFCFVLAGCSGATVSMPANYNNVTSNGGFVVGAGNYLYFANAYQDYTNISSKENVEGDKVTTYALNRAEIVSGSLKNDEDENVVTEKVLSRIAGFDVSNMFVVGESLYFTTPNVHKNTSKEDDKYNQTNFKRTSLFRIKLDGSGLKEVYTTENDGGEFYLTGGQNKTILIYDDEKILRVNAYENATKADTLAEDVKSVRFPETLGLEFVDVYFTANREETESASFTGNILKKLNLQTKEILDVSGYDNNGETITLISYNGERLMYTRTGVPGKDALYANDFSNGSASEKRFDHDTSNFTSSSTIYIIKSVEYDKDVFVFEYKDKIFMQNFADGKSEILTTEGSIVFVDGTYVYYTTENGIYRVSVLGAHTVKQVSDMKNFNQSLIDFDGKYVYFYAEVENTTSKVKYLHRADVDIADENTRIQRLGTLSEDDAKTLADLETAE